MSILRKLTLRTMKKNPKRTLVTIVGIVLATALITAVANLAESFHDSMVIYERETEGDFHYCFSGVKPENLKYFENNKNLEKISIAREVGYALLEDSKNPDKPYIYLVNMDERCRDMAALQLNSGRWPENENEIVISSHMRSNGGSRLTVGDRVTLTLGTRELGDEYLADQDTAYLGEEERFEASGRREYTVVGIMKRPTYLVEPRMAPGYTALTLASDQEERCTVYASYTSQGLKHRSEVTEALKVYAVSGRMNSELIRWETLHFSGRTMTMVYSMGAIAILVIIVTSVFCIRNSFQISLTEKLRMYGMLTTVGMTAKQRKKLVYHEALYLGIIGIPLGIGSGVLATYVLVKVCGELVRYAVDMKLYYAFSLPAVIVGAVLAAVVIFLSAFRSAGKASRISPISAIRSNETIRRGKGDIHAPGWVRRLFGVGGVIAYKNLCRSKVKYRATVISIVVSVSVFIGMTTFVHLGFQVPQMQNSAGDYPLVVTLQDEERAEEAALICSWEEVREPLLLRQAIEGVVPAQQAVAGAAVGEPGRFVELSMNQNKDYKLWIYSMGETAYHAYCREVGVSPEEAERGAIVYAEYRMGMDSGRGMKYYEGTIAEFQKGSTLDAGFPPRGEETEGNADGKKIIPLPVVCQTKVQPPFVRGWDNTRIICVVSDAWLEENLSDYVYPQLSLYIMCDDADALETRVRNDVPLYSYYISNYQRSMKEEQNFMLLVAIFLYGFITVIALIGVTNIFNTVTTNMELRSREFAMLKSVGMTHREFGRMVQLESVFYGGGALGIGIPLGCALSGLFHTVFGISAELPYEFPLKGIVIAVAAVTLLLFGIMRYSMGKIDRRDIVATIQNENI